MRKIHLFYLIALFSFFAKAQNSPSYSNEFLQIGVDASAFAKAGAVVASTDNVNAVYWNPSALTRLDDKQLSLMHSSYYANIANYDHAAFAMPLEATTQNEFPANNALNTGVVGFAFYRFGVDNILDTRNLVGDDGAVVSVANLNRFSAVDYAFTISFAKKYKQSPLSFGGTVKIIRRIIGDFASSWGAGIDAGLFYKKNLSSWSYGLKVSDLTTTYNAWSIDDAIFVVDNDQDNNTLSDYQLLLEAQQVPNDIEITIPSVQFGVNRSFDLKKNFSLDLELDMFMRFIESSAIISTSIFSITPSIGFSLDYSKMVFIRAGVGNFQNEINFDNSQQVIFDPSLGVGVHYRGFSIDYALTNIGSTESGQFSHVFSLLMDWQVFE